MATILKCKICGGDIDVNPDNRLGTCQYCGTTMTIPLIDSDKKAKLFNRAIQYLNNCEFDKAYSAYESIASEDELESEVYWGMILSEYGIEYVEDPRENKRIPTCHRTRILSPKKTTHYNLAIKNASDEQRELYMKEADEIERLQNSIKSISSKEKPYDVFICYKYSDENGNPTEDSAISHEIYDALEQSGLRVFFSKITLEDKLGTEYEPYIYAALKSSKLLLLVTTKREYCESVWVKNEWSRFLEFMRYDKEKNIIPVYKNISPDNLPEELQKFQGLDMSKLGALQDLKHVVKKQIDWSKQNTPTLNIGKMSIKKDYLKWGAIAISGLAIAIVVMVAVFSLKKAQLKSAYDNQSTKESLAVDESVPDMDPSVQDNSVSAEEQDNKTQEEPSDVGIETHEQELEDYAKKQSYLNGLTGSFKTELATDYMKRDLSEVPTGNIDCFIDDFDKDGEAELLIPSVERNQMITLSMYEYKDTVELSDQYEYRVSTMAGDSGKTVSFTYDYDEEKYIGMFTDDSKYITGDGISLDFAGVTYNGREFVIKGFTEYAGSDGYEDKNFMKTLQNCGIRIGWNTLMGEEAWKDVLSVAGGHLLFEVSTRINEPEAYWGDDMPLYGYVRFTGYSPYDFTYNDGTVAEEQSSDMASYGMEERYIYVNAPDGYVNFRKGPGTDYDVLMKIYNGSQLKMLYGDIVSDKWVKAAYWVDDGWDEGWVASSQMSYTNDNYDFVIPDSSERYLSEADLIGLSNDELKIARNEIAARHGRRFKDAALQAYFDTKSWYVGTVDPDDFNVNTMLNDFEKKNMDFIKSYED